jgi:hypothetical protein
MPRRRFLGVAAGAALGTGFLGRYYELAAAEVNHAKIRDVQVMLMQGGRTYTTPKDEPLDTPTTIPPTIPAIIPAKSGAPEARAMPRQRGTATKNTTMLAGKSFLRVVKTPRCLKVFIFF